MKLLKKSKLAKRLLCLLLSTFMIMSVLPMGMVAEETSSPFTLVATETIETWENGTYFTSDISTVQAAIVSGGYIEIDASASSDGAWFQAGVVDSNNTEWDSTASSVGWINGNDSVTIVITYADFATVSNLQGSWTGIYVQGNSSTLTVTEIRAYSCDGTVDVLGMQKSTSTLSILSGADFNDTELYLYINYTLNDTSKSSYEPGSLCDSSWHSVVSLSNYNACGGTYKISLVDLASAFSSYTYTDNSSGETVTVTNYDVTSSGVVLNFWGTSYATFVSAQLVRVSSASATEYTISVSECENGSVSASATSATAGTTITLTATPAEGYELSEWNVTDSTGATVTVTDNTFTMPAGNVTVSATFVEETATVETVKVGDTVTVDGIKYTVVATDTDGSNGSSGGNNTGYGKWLESATISSYLTTTSEALIYVEYTSSGTRYQANVGLQFNIDGSYKDVASNNTQPIFKESSTLTYVTFSVADLVATAEDTGYSVNNFAQIYSTLSSSTQTYIYSVSIVVPSSTDGGVCEEISSDKFTLSNITTNEDGSYTGNTSASTSYIDVPIDNVENGSTVLVHLTGTTDATFRVWLHSESSDNDSDTYYYYVSSGTSFDIFIPLTVNGGYDATTIRIKGYDWQTYVTNLTLTHVGIVYEPTSTTSAAHTVNLAASGKGTITSDVTTAKSGATVTLTATAETGYELSSITVNGTEISGTTFTMPNTDADVVATFVFSGNDDCGYSIAMSSSSVRSIFSSSVGVTEDESISSSASNFELILPYDVSVGGTVTVHIVGTSNSNFRIWLGDNWDDKSNQVNAVDDLGYSGSGDFDFTFTLTVNQDESDAGYIMFKGVNGSNLDSFTLTHVGITYQPPTFYGKTLTLDGEIGVTYYFNMDGVTNPGAYYLVATVDGETAETVTASPKTLSNGTTYYRYTVYVNPTDIDSDIVAYLTNGSGTTVSIDTFSAYSYCDYAITNKDNGWSSEASICTAVLNYAYYAMVYANDNGASDFRTKLTTLLDSDWSDPVTTETWTDLGEDYGSTAYQSVDKTLALGDGGIYIVMYVTDATSTYTVDNVNLEVQQAGETYYVEFKVPAKQMSETFTVYKGDEIYATYSVYTYINNQISDKGTSEDEDVQKLVNLCKAIYQYGKAALSYSNWN